MDNLKLDAWCMVLCIVAESTNCTITSIHKSSGFTYAHLVDIIRLLKDKGLLITKHSGRVTNVSLTTKGRECAGYINKIFVLAQIIE